MEIADPPRRFSLNTGTAGEISTQENQDCLISPVGIGGARSMSEVPNKMI